MNVDEPQVYYQERLTELKEKLAEFSRNRGMLSWTRLAVIAAMIFTIVWLWTCGLRYGYLSMEPFLVILG